MTSFNPGDRVRCVNSSEYRADQAPDGNLERGRDYVVIAMNPDSGGVRVEGYRFLARDGGNSWWSNDRFKLIERSDEQTNNSLPEQPTPSTPW